MIKNIFNRLNVIIFGKRPFNTIFSFNYHNISHIVKFLNKSNSYIDTSNNILLDVGAGASPYYELFHDLVSSYIAVDMEAALPKNEKRAITHKIGTAECLPIDSDSIDIVMSNQVLEHVLDEKLAIQESFRVLKEGGFFIGSVPHISPIHLEPYDFRRFTFFGLKKILEDNGFKVLKIEGNGGVHKAIALTLTMDWFLSKREEGKPQKFLNYKHFAFFLLTGIINFLAIIGDKIIGDKKRSPSNYCWIAKKQSIGENGTSMSFNKKINFISNS